MRRRFATLLLFLLPSGLSSQINPFPRTLVPDSNRASLQFERNINTYFWNSDTRYLFEDDDLFLQVRNGFTSTYMSHQFRSFRDEENFSFRTAGRLSDEFSGAGEIRSLILSDNQTLSAGNAAIHTAAAGVRYRPEPNISILPMGGIRYDKQQLQADHGPNYRLLAEADSLEFGGYRAAVAGTIDQSELGFRQFKNNGGHLRIAAEFGGGSSDSLQLRWELKRNDFYVPADTNVINTFGVRQNIRSRNEELFGIHNDLVYDIGGGLRSRAVIQVESRSITNNFHYQSFAVPENIPFGTEVNEFRMAGGVDLDYAAGAGIFLVGFRADERNERHQLRIPDGIDQNIIADRRRIEARLDNSSFRNSLNVSYTGELTPADRITVVGSVNLLQYDTPDTVNTDDRDELLINVSVKGSHWYNETFTAAVTAEVTLAHLVYLSREKSANNNWNRIYRLMPEFTYRPNRSFRMMNAFEVLANYTVFDFESVIPIVKSYSYRQVAFLDSTSYDVTERVGIDLFGYVRIFERGELRWPAFSERPLQRIEEVTFSPQLRYSDRERWVFAVGFRSFAQKRFTYVDNQRKFESTFLSAGPTANISLRLSHRSMVELRGWKEYQRQAGGVFREFSNMTMNVRYYF